MASATSSNELRGHLVDLLVPILTALALDLEDLSVQRVGRRSVLRVLVDGEDGVDLDDITAVSRAVSEALDRDDPRDPVLAGPFVLEVSSPGVDRPLTEPRHWRRAIGRLVDVDANGAVVTGRVSAVDDAGVLLQVGNLECSVEWPALGTGKVQVEFSRPSAARATEHGSEGRST